MVFSHLAPSEWDGGPGLVRFVVSGRGERAEVKTAAGAMVVQIVHFSHLASKDVELLGSAPNEEELATPEALPRRSGRASLGLSVAQSAASGGPLEIVSSRPAHLWDALVAAYDTLGFPHLDGGDEEPAVTEVCSLDVVYGASSAVFIPRPAWSQQVVR